MNGISTSGTSGRETTDQQLQSLRAEFKYLQDQINGRPSFVGITGDKYPGGLPAGSVVTKAVNGGISIATVGKGGRVDAQVEITSTSQGFSGFTSTGALPTTDDIPTGKFGFHEDTSRGNTEIYYNSSGTIVDMGTEEPEDRTLVRRDQNGWVHGEALRMNSSLYYGPSFIQVVGAQQPAIADSAAASFAAVNTKINEILAMLRTHGLIAT